jgi:hypothetical protein
MIASKSGVPTADCSIFIYRWISRWNQGMWAENSTRSRGMTTSRVILGSEAPSRFVLDEGGSRMAEIRLKRAYEEPAPDDGLRVLVERLWPRGLSKERAAESDRGSVKRDSRTTIVRRPRLTPLVRTDVLWDDAYWRRADFLDLVATVHRPGRCARTVAPVRFDRAEGGTR